MSDAAFVALIAAGLVAIVAVDLRLRRKRSDVARSDRMKA